MRLGAFVILALGTSIDPFLRSRILGAIHYLLHIYLDSEDPGLFMRRILVDTLSRALALTHSHSSVMTCYYDA